MKNFLKGLFEGFIALAATITAFYAYESLFNSVGWYLTDENFKFMDALKYVYTNTVNLIDEGMASGGFGFGRILHTSSTSWEYALPAYALSIPVWSDMGHNTPDKYSQFTNGYINVIGGIFAISKGLSGVK